MSVHFLEHARVAEDNGVRGMTTYALDEVHLTVLAGLSCRGEDFDEIEMLRAKQLSWLRRFLP